MLGPMEDLISRARENPKSQTVDQLELIHRNMLRLLKLVNTLLDFSRIEAGRMQAIYRPVDICKMTEELTSVFRSACERANLYLKFQFDNSIVDPIYLDIDLFEKIVLNLLSNAYKFTLHGGITVTIKKSTTAQGIQLEIQDTGVGIPEEELPKLFERFHRIQESRGRSFEGTGIGLAMVNELVKLHGGNIIAKSILGDGSLFTVFFPFGFSHLPSDSVKHVSLNNLSINSNNNHNNHNNKSYSRSEDWWIGRETVSTTTTTSNNNSNNSNNSSPNDKMEINDEKPKILIVDDNADMREYIFNLLKENYYIETAIDGIDALEKLNKYEPELILTDIMMPRLDGTGLLLKLRENKKTKTIPVVFLSARAGEEARVEGLKLGADDYLTKPFTARELQARIKTHIELYRIRQEAASQAELANKAKDNFLAVLSHELRTPLTPALMLAESLERNTDLPISARSDLEIITKSIKLEVRLIDGIVIFFIFLYYFSLFLLFFIIFFFIIFIVFIFIFNLYNVIFI